MTIYCNEVPWIVIFYFKSALESEEPLAITITNPSPPKKKISVCLFSMSIILPKTVEALKGTLFCGSSGLEKTVD